jgi:hypothetical protein
MSEPDEFWILLLYSRDKLFKTLFASGPMRVSTFVKEV